MDNNLQHEDLLIKLRAKLNQEKVKLWEPPFITQDNEITQDFKVITYYEWNVGIILSLELTVLRTPI